MTNKHTRRLWSATELYLMRELYPDLPTEDVAALLGRKIGTVHQCAARYGLQKSAYFHAQDKSGRIKRAAENPRMKIGRFKPGLIPWNAGRKGWQAGGRSEKTQFHSGALPPNTMPIGSYRVTTHSTGGKLESKVREVPGASNKRWVPVTRMVWEEANGPVPKGCIVVFKPGCKSLVRDEITLDKLDCITRAENAWRNHPSQTNPELGKLYQLKGAITRQVNRINRERKNEPTPHQPTA